MAAALLATPFADLLLEERDVTRGVWRNTGNMNQALEEIVDLSKRDRDAAVSKISRLYGMVRTEFETHFDMKFDPHAETLPNARRLAGAYLPTYCRQVFATLQRMELA